eukprot:CAMPEP_0197181688 /NCGR_PEP_ID=MMETSP1423-20130617/5897_1 /TAXON_ID=476441 /ORGANISM="Pseudo-nitzschia heimii, Strain UNC1101" /LENGTH=475 /DNA_ID=CAMNT_0042631983 /DNA_START=80 /DNA_END=1507 /DNA_ORIENTATION=-
MALSSSSSRMKNSRSRLRRSFAVVATAALTVVAVAALTALPASSASASSHYVPVEVTDDLIGWINDLEGGFYQLAQKQRPRYKGGGYRPGRYVSHHPLLKGEILVQVPWRALLGSRGSSSSSSSSREGEEEGGEENNRQRCRLLKAILSEVTDRGETSFYAPHLRHLGLLDDDAGEELPTTVRPIPALWSDEGKALLEEIGHLGGRAGVGIDAPLDELRSCVDDDDDDHPAVSEALFSKVAAVVAAHGSSSPFLEEEERNRPVSGYGVLVPFLDNLHYNRCGTSEIREPNVREVLTHGKSFQLIAIRDIAVGEEILRSSDVVAFSSSSLSSVAVTAPENLRDLGIVDTQYYPKTFFFSSRRDDDDETGSIDVVVVVGWDDDVEDYVADLTLVDVDGEPRDHRDRLERFFRPELERLRGIVVDDVDADAVEKKKIVIPDRELEAAKAHRDNLVFALELSLEALDDEEEEEGGGDEL